MIKNKTEWFLVSFLCLALWSASTSVADEKWLSPLEEDEWQTYMDLGVDANQRAEFAEAAKHFHAAAEIAKEFLITHHSQPV